MFKGILDKIFNTNQPTKRVDVHPISQAEVEALVEAKIREHAATLQSATNDQLIQSQSKDHEDYSLTPKQIEYALSLIEKIKPEFELAIDSAHLTIKDLNRLIAYNRYKNKGTLVNLVKKGVLRKR
ncbi:ABC transporter ATP-binding protein [Bacillus sp. UNC41MFS5]|uniref:ABC transporter ATP-binding protein n=1 Tax=Bacillus sp. UNC41MFS5 TaxID=1449046 RepID=UPI0009DED460|nr:ABC transporter ATP-binding protein [Bacillus sp. UNC41MFS5]